MGWLSVANSLIFGLPWMLGGRISGVDMFCATVWPAGVLLQLLSMRFVYWDTDEHAIQQHRFGRHRTVPFSEITTVTGQAEWSSKPSYLKIRYVANPDDAKVRRLNASPRDMDGFIDVLRRRASSATIEL